MNNKKGETFGQRLRNLRTSKGLSQKQFADLLGYKHHASVSNIEADKTPPDIIALVKIADALQVDLHWLITGEHYDPNKRLISQFQTVSAQLQEEMQAAQEVIGQLETIKASGVKLTSEQEQQYFQNRGIVRSRLRQIQQFFDPPQPENPL